MNRKAKRTVTRVLGIVGAILAGPAFIISLKTADYIGAAFALGFLAFCIYLMKKGEF